jgi:hypothetical protein
MIGTYVPEQILRGKVIDLLPDRTALVQLGARKIIARVVSLQPPLKPGDDYLFQIKQANSNPPTAVVVGHRNETQQEKSPSSMIHDLLDAFDLKESPANSGLAKIFLDSGEPVSRNVLVTAGSLISSKANLPGALHAINWLVNRHLPLTKSFFDTTIQLMKSEPLAAQLSHLQKAIAESAVATPSMTALKQSISSLQKINGLPEPAMTAGFIGREQAAHLLQSFFQNKVPAFHHDPNAVAEFLNSPMSPSDAANLLDKLAVRMKPEQFLSRFHQLLLTQPEIQNILSATDPRTPIGLLLNTLKAIGFDDEQNLRNQLAANGTLHATDSLKEKLIALVNDAHAPAEIKNLAGDTLGKITGQQLQMASADPLIAQFSFQVPIPYRDKVKSLSVYWESKRDKRGKLDPDSCVILLHLDLTHLHETLISVHVQNRDISVNVQNETTDLRTLLKENESELNGQLSALNYHLISVIQTEKIDRKLAVKAQQPLTVSNYNLDLRV